ncbi:hypothetical protein AMK26_12645 [Streptomyces sp. CB03234]|uniref:DUF4190 domain-containing protein n=1 Tax=Streptomyces sp. (strain CB03234) TaxID=1703937 RepID=UPI000939730C|nr:hypothetical protein AMK26_12645 [Streptomyces sp. CB03234]
MPEMSDPNDPWAPPESRPPQPPPYQPPPGVHDQPTMTSIPGTGGELPPPPTAPGGPAQSTPYGYPAPMPPTGAYGYPGYPGYVQPGWQQVPSNGMGIAALVLGIVSVVVFCLYGLGIILGILALVFGIIGRKKAQRGEATNNGMAITGIILGAVGIVASAAFLAFAIWMIVTHGNTDTYEEEHGSDPFGTSLVSHR